MRPVTELMLATRTNRICPDWKWHDGTAGNIWIGRLRKRRVTQARERRKEKDFVFKSPPLGHSISAGSSLPVRWPEEAGSGHIKFVRSGCAIFGRGWGGRGWSGAAGFGPPVPVTLLV